MAFPVQRSYADVIMQGFGHVGNAIDENRRRADALARQQQEADWKEQDYARQLGLDEYQKSQDTIANQQRNRQIAVQESQANDPYEVGNSLVQRGTYKELYRGPDSALNVYREPPRFEIDPATGRQRPVAGGPMDPAYIAEAAKARGQATRQRTLPQTAVDKISGAGEGLINQNRLSDTFQDQYAGWGSPAVGNAANAVTRYTGIGDDEGANWWQDYQRQKNIVRNQLFGSALTVTEKAEFERSDINPGMQPEIIKENLKRQKAAAARAAKKLAGAYLSQGYNPEVIEANIGMSLEDLGLAAPGGAEEPPPDIDSNDTPIGATATNPETGERVRFDGTNWVPY